MFITGKVLIIELNATIKGQKGTYKGAELIYKDPNGETKTKAFHENALKFNAALKNGLENISAGDDFTAELEKKDEFWNWISIVKGVDASPAPSASKPSASAAAKVSTGGGSTYATAEERALTQQYIVRQSSITAALKLLEINGNKKATTDEAITIAAQFEAWVFGKSVVRQDVPDPAADIANMEDDIPY